MRLAPLVVAVAACLGLSACGSPAAAAPPATTPAATAAPLVATPAPTPMATPAVDDNPHPAPAGLIDVAARSECGIPDGTVKAAGRQLVISLACQELSSYQDGVPVLSTWVTTGRPALPTPPGHYSVLTTSHPFEMVSGWPYGTIGWYAPSWVTWVLWFRNDGYGIHDASWRTAYGPGTNADGSHGCVNVPHAAMQQLYGWAGTGTTVDIA